MLHHESDILVALESQENDGGSFRCVQLGFVSIERSWSNSTSILKKKKNLLRVYRSLETLLTIGLSKEPLAINGWLERTVTFIEGTVTDRLAPHLEIRAAIWTQYDSRKREPKERESERGKENHEVRREMRGDRGS